jgi:hypothetical protein
VEVVPRSCTVCSHPESFAINEALVVEGASNRAITRRFDLSKDAIRRHREHIPELLVKASRAQEVADADNLLDRLECWAKRIEDACSAVEGSKDYAEFWRGVSVLRSYLETIGEITKELERRPQVNIALFEHPDYQRLEDTLVRALEPYDAARYAVAGALKELQ